MDMVFRNVGGYTNDRWYKTVRDADGSERRVPSKAYGCTSRYAARYVDAEGQPHQKVFVLEREAKAWLRAQLATVDAGTHTDPRAARVTVGAFYEAHVAGTDGHLAPSTRGKYDGWWANYVRPRWGNVPLEKVTATGMRAWVTELTDSGLVAGTVRSIYYVMTNILNTAVELHVLKTSPAANVRLPKDKPTRHVYLTHDQVAALAADAAAVSEREQDATAIRFLGYTGVRIGELSKLTVGSVSMGTRRVWVLGKGDKARSVPFPEPLSAELAKLIQDRAVDAPLFPTVRGKHIDQHWQETVFNVAVARRQDADHTFPREFTPHGLRHTAASLAVASGASVLGVQRMLGHSKPSITLNVYADLFDSDLDAVADRMGAAIASAESLRNQCAAEAVNTASDQDNTPPAA